MTFPGNMDSQVRGRSGGGLQRNFGDSSAQAGVALSGVRLSLRVSLAAFVTGFLRRNEKSRVGVKVCDELIAASGHMHVPIWAAALGILVQFDTAGLRDLSADRSKMTSR